MADDDVSHFSPRELAPLERLFADAYAAVWREIATYLYLQLRVEFTALSEAELARIALGLTERLRREMGGQQAYLPRGRSFELSDRDREIGATFNGRNLRELARQYDLSDVRIRQIHATWLAEQIAQRQGRLPLDV
ncbi:MAG: hypothetical protein AzoDbin1_05143 [Azoarcus sp.]|nr:hypothetical protein [Azoarcus sp.]